MKSHFPTPNPFTDPKTCCFMAWERLPAFDWTKGTQTKVKNFLDFLRSRLALFSSPTRRKKKHSFLSFLQPVLKASNFFPSEESYNKRRRKATTNSTWIPRTSWAPAPCCFVAFPYFWAIAVRANSSRRLRRVKRKSERRRCPSLMSRWASCSRRCSRVSKGKRILTSKWQSDVCCENCAKLTRRV